MKEIPIKQLKTDVVAYAQIDDEDFDKIAARKWTLTNMGYVQSTNNGTRLHRLIMGITNPKIGIDHIDHNKLNCQRSNLRICNQSQNGGNRIKNSINNGKPLSSKYKGVYWNKEKRKWGVSVKFQKNRIFLGYYPIEEQAALAYNSCAKKKFGEFALLNVIEEKENPWFG